MFGVVVNLFVELWLIVCVVDDYFIGFCDVFEIVFWIIKGNGIFGNVVSGLNDYCVGFGCVVNFVFFGFFKKLVIFGMVGSNLFD